ncbi:MAG TPA: hypothetical protein VF103_15095 [Polyangiaceae bacterium]
MTPRERIDRLEGLLARVAKNAARPRSVRAAPTLMSTPDSAPAVAAPAPAVLSKAPVPVEPLSPPPPPVVPSPAAPPPSPSSAPPWRPEPASTVQARPSSIPPEELSEDDLVEVTTVPPAAPATEASPSVAEEEEEPPSSSRRSKVVAESLDQAIASAAAQTDEHEVPIHTPPPESGPQEAVLPVGIEAPRAPEFGDDLDAELPPRPASLGPTPEQLGETIELEGAEGPEIEIEVAGLPAPEPERERPVEELEVALPRAEMPSGTYDVSDSVPAPAVAVQSSSAPTPPPQAHQGPEITARPELHASDVARVIRVSDKAPEDFKELLDASLAL